MAFFQAIRKQCNAKLLLSFIRSESKWTKIAPHDIYIMEHRYGFKNYCPLPVVLSRGQGVFVWDLEGRKYYDFLSAYCSINQGHCHPRIIAALKKQAEKLTLVSRAFYNDKLGLYEKFMSELFGYDRVLPMNTGAEGCESALKLARKWGYECKLIPKNTAKVVLAKNNFWGRTLAACSSSSNPAAYEGFGPYMPGFELVPYNDIPALEKKLEDPYVCALMLEPIQGEAGVIVPDKGYLTKVRELCTQHEVLWIDDEVQTGLGRTGRLLAADHDCVKPDIVVLGKALGGGVLPISAVLCNDGVMQVLTLGTHGSTYGGNSLACAVALESMKVILEEKMIINAADLECVFRDELGKLPKDKVVDVRGKGLFFGIELHKGYDPDELCLKFRDAGVLVKNTIGQTIRFAPPLVITEKQLREACGIMRKVIECEI